MKINLMLFLCALLGTCGLQQSTAAEPFQFRDLFNGKDLNGWVNVNTDNDTWTVRDGLLVCSGHPIGVMRTDRQYENFILHIEWRHMESGGNSGVFAWSDGTVPAGRRLPKGLEVQMLELDWVKLHKQKDGKSPPIAYVHGELFGANGLKIIPDNPRGSRSKSLENRCKGKGEWNVYDVVFVDGTVKLSVNGKFVNGVSKSSIKKGYLCLESEGAEIHFRKIQIMELPPGISPLGIFGATDPTKAADWARIDSRLTHPHQVCQDACAVFVAAIATAIGAGSTARECYEAALGQAERSSVVDPVADALGHAAERPPGDYQTHQGWVLIALQNAFYQLLHASSLEEGVVNTVMAGGDTDTNAAIAGALLGAVHGREAIPRQWLSSILSCRPLPKSGTSHPRPSEFWPVDALRLAERLLLVETQQESGTQ